MPGYRVHLVGGGIAAGAVLLLLAASGCMSLQQDYLLMLYCFVAGLAGALFPDIDVKSKGQNYFYWIVFYFCSIIMRIINLIVVQELLCCARYPY